GEAIDLSGLPLPMTLTAERRDRGALDATPMMTEGDRLSIAFSPDDRLDNTQGVVRFTQDGRVYVN
ncbi:MAG: hypothetical protein AAFX40_19810, partial [Cyanobacteria bacterium J06639_1]